MTRSVVRSVLLAATLSAVAAQGAAAQADAAPWSRIIVAPQVGVVVDHSNGAERNVLASVVAEMPVGNGWSVAAEWTRPYGGAIEVTTQKQPGERFPDWTHAAAAIDYVFHHVQSDPAQRAKNEKQKVDRERSQDADAHFVRMNSESDGVISGFRPRCLADIVLLNEDSDLIGTSTEQGATTDIGSADQLAEPAPPTPDTSAATAPASPPPSTQRSNEPTAEIQPSPPEHASRSLQQVLHRWGLRRGPRLNAVLMLALTFVAGAGTALIASALASEERAQLALFQAVPREIPLLMVTAPEAPSRPLDSTPVAAPATPDAHPAVSRPTPLRATGNPRPNILDSSPKGPRSSVIKDWETRRDTEASSARPQ